MVSTTSFKYAHSVTKKSQTIIFLGVTLLHIIEYILYRPITVSTYFILLLIGFLFYGKKKNKKSSFFLLNFKQILE